MKSTRRGFLGFLAALPIIGKVAMEDGVKEAIAQAENSGALWLNINKMEVEYVTKDEIRKIEVNDPPMEFQKRVSVLSVRRPRASHIKLPQECWEILAQEDIGE
jgi:hypothetical protein